MDDGGLNDARSLFSSRGGGWSKGRARLACFVAPSPFGLSVGDPSSGRLCRVGRVEGGALALCWRSEAKARAVTMSERTSMGLAGVDLDPVHRPGERALLRTVD